LAEVALLADEVEVAYGRVSEVLAAHDLAALRGIDQLFRLHAVCLQVLARAEDERLPQLAQVVYAELQDHAAKVKGRKLRRHFLEGIGPHRVIGQWATTAVVSSS
jgi:hypothetical protein